MSKTRVLFLCTGNTARSQMAEAFLRAQGGDDYEAFSAGFAPREINPLTVKVMEERGLDLSGQHAKGLDEYLGKVHFGYLVNMCQRTEPECPKTFPGMGTRLDWPFEDPSAFEGTDEERLEKFREVRDAIEGRVLEWLAER
ncbi:MAG TPA: arsenate reductase ArsC [Thermoleophilia bacterium]|nr:arsenate reductase ArsC [Thermoleophilia bacterium]